MANNPRLSVNKLAEYMTADPIRRRQIVRDAKHQEPFKTSRYASARNAIKAYISSGYNEDIINKAKKSISTRIADSDFQRDDIRNSILALEHVLYMDFPVLDEYEVKVFNDENTLIKLSGLDVSVNPDLKILNHNNEKIGAVKIHISKTNKLDEINLEYVSTLIKYFFLMTGNKEKNIENHLCISFDIFGESFIVSPKAYKRSISRILAACEEIVARWDTI